MRAVKLLEWSGKADSRVNQKVTEAAAWVWQRLPPLFVACVYLALLVSAPSQMVDVFGSLNTEFVRCLVALVPVILAGAAYRIMISTDAAAKHWSDTVVAALPSIVLAVMFLVWTPRGWLAAFLTLAASVSLIRWANNQMYRPVPICNPAANATKRSTWRARWVVIIAAITIAAFVACTVLLAISPQRLPQLVGPLGVLTIAMALLSLLSGFALKRPWFILGFICVCYLLPTVNPASVSLLIGKRTGIALHVGLAEWVKSRGDLRQYKSAGRPYPVLIASAEGGGIYAAAHSYMVLRKMGVVCPNFAEHLFATVGVSGGSVGTLWYSSHAKKQDVARQASSCKQTNSKEDAALIDQTEFLKDDLLSPTLANLLFHQTSNFLVPLFRIFADGGDVMAEAVAQVGGDPETKKKGLREGWDPSGTSPATLFVATDSETGGRFVFSPFMQNIGMVGTTFPSGDVTYDDIAKNKAAVVSATFPFLTPMARLPLDDKHYKVLADGGYVENSGADVAVELARHMRALDGKPVPPCADDDPKCLCKFVFHASYDDSAEWSGCDIHLTIAYLPMLGFADRTPTNRFRESYVMGPLGTVVRARTAKEEYRIDESRAEFNPTPEGLFWANTARSGYFPHYLAVDAFDLPLGWKLSDHALRVIEQNSAPISVCELTNDDTEGSSQVTSNGEADDVDYASADIGSLDPSQTVAYDSACNMRMLASLLTLDPQNQGIAKDGY